MISYLGKDHHAMGEFGFSVKIALKLYWPCLKKSLISSNIFVIGQWN